MSAAATAFGDRSRWLAAAVRACRPSEVLREHAALIAIMLGYIGAAAYASHALGRSAEFRQLWSFYTTFFNLLLAACVAAALCACWAARAARSRGAAARGREGLLAACAVPERIIIGLPLVILLPGFLASVTAVKTAIPAVNPYHWDALLAHWDQAIHFGRHPWVWLQPLLGHPALTNAINLLYHPGYFLGIYLVLFWQAFTLKRRQLRMRFLLSFMLAWIVLGSLAATGLSSVGPCYYADFVAGVDPYAPLMEYLRAARMDTGVPWATDIQQFLLDAHRSNTALGGVGISAMPSLHVSVTFLFALLGWQYGRWVRWLFAGIAAVTLVGSVHLGWHYALDGYAAIAGTWLIWHAVGRALARAGARTAHRCPPAGQLAGAPS